MLSFTNLYSMMHLIIVLNFVCFLAVEMIWFVKIARLSSIQDPKLMIYGNPSQNLRQIDTDAILIKFKLFNYSDLYHLKIFDYY